MQRTLNYTITAKEQLLTIEQFLRLQGYSRHVISQLKHTENGILHNGNWARTTQTLQSSDTLTINIIENEASENIEPINIPIHIVYEDEDLLVLNKPADMPIHPSQGNYLNTLANGVAYYFASQKQPFIYRCINRLDRDTTGLLILAKHMLSGAILSQMMKERRISRTYLALVEGKPPAQGTITTPIGRKPGSTIERLIDYKNGESAITHYKLLKTAYDHSLIQLQLDTGRTHQIRVHMNSIGHPLLGDTLYNPETQLMKRQALHSQKLAFEHPITKDYMQFECPIPSDMCKILSPNN